MKLEKPIIHNDPPLQQQVTTTTLVISPEPAKPIENDFERSIREHEEKKRIHETQIEEMKKRRKARHEKALEKSKLTAVQEQNKEIGCGSSTPQQPSPPSVIPAESIKSPEAPGFHQSTENEKKIMQGGRPDVQAPEPPKKEDTIG